MRLGLMTAHGGGSFPQAGGHEPRFLDHPDDPLRLARVAAASRRLNSIVVDALIAAGQPAVAVPGSLLARCDEGRVVAVRTELVTSLLDSRCLPVLYGDVAPDTTRGGTIASTEPLLALLAADLLPARIILATDVDGVYEGDPAAVPPGTSAMEPIERITPDTAPPLLARIGGTRREAIDVTGGMASKVALMVAAVEAQPELEVRILSGLRPGAVVAALRGDPEAGGTLIRSD